MSKFKVGDKIAYPDWDDGPYYGVIREVYRDNNGDLHYDSEYYVDWEDSHTQRVKDFVGWEINDEGEELFLDNELAVDDREI